MTIDRTTRDDDEYDVRGDVMCTSLCRTITSVRKYTTTSVGHRLVLTVLCAQCVFGRRLG